MVSEFFIIGVTLVSALIASFAQYIFKKSIPKFHFSGKDLMGLLGNRMLMAGLAIYVADLAVYLVALHYGQLSFVYPVFASSFIFTLLLSKFVLHEKASAMRVLGILLVFAGIVIVSITF